MSPSALSVIARYRPTITGSHLQSPCGLTATVADRSTTSQNIVSPSDIVNTRLSYESCRSSCL